MTLAKEQLASSVVYETINAPRSYNILPEQTQKYRTYMTHRKIISDYVKRKFTTRKKTTIILRWKNRVSGK